MDMKIFEYVNFFVIMAEQKFSYLSLCIKSSRQLSFYDAIVKVLLIAYVKIDTICYLLDRNNTFQVNF